MMKRILKFGRRLGGRAGCVCVLSIFFILSCSEEMTVESILSIASVPVEVTVPASLEDGSPVRDTLVIRANRSWTAMAVNPLDRTTSVDWVKLSDNEVSSISGGSFDTELVLTFADNIGRRPRCCEIKLHCGGGVFTVPVRQAERESNEKDGIL